MMKMREGKKLFGLFWDGGARGIQKKIKAEFISRAHENQAL